jgi:small subunit ribosomal protein S21
MITVEVRKNDVERAIKILGRKLEKDKILKEAKMKGYYEKPSDKKRRKLGEACRRIKRYQSRHGK